MYVSLLLSLNLCMHFDYTPFATNASEWKWIYWFQVEMIIYYYVHIQFCVFILKLFCDPFVHPLLLFTIFGGSKTRISPMFSATTDKLVKLWACTDVWMCGFKYIQFNKFLVYLIFSWTLNVECLNKRINRI